jgi:hypothetical protein
MPEYELTLENRKEINLLITEVLGYKRGTNQYSETLFDMYGYIQRKHNEFGHQTDYQDYGLVKYWFMKRV